MRCKGPCTVCDSLRRQTERPTCLDCPEPADIRELATGEARCWFHWKRREALREPLDLSEFVT